MIQPLHDAEGLELDPDPNDLIDRGHCLQLLPVHADRYDSIRAYRDAHAGRCPCDYNTPDIWDPGMSYLDQTAGRKITESRYISNTIGDIHTMIDDDIDGLITVRDAAKTYGGSYQSWCEWVHKYHVTPVKKIGFYTYYNISDLEVMWMNHNKSKVRTPPTHIGNTDMASETVVHEPDGDVSSIVLQIRDIKITITMTRREEQR